MSTQKALTFEDVNAHIEKHLPADKSKNLTATASDLCSIYVIVRPILILASQAFFIPEKWRDGIKALIAALDAICHGS